MTKQEAIDRLTAADEDATWESSEVAEIFEVLYGRPPGEEDIDILSLCYAAI